MKSKILSFRAELLLLLVTMIWGGTFVFIKDAVAEISPYMFTTLRFALALAVSLIFWGKYLRGITRQDVKQGSVLGIMYAVGYVLQTIGLQYTSVSKSGFVTGSLVVIVPIAYWFVERREVTLSQKIGVALAGIGLWIFTNPQWDNINIGDILTLFSAILWAFYVVYLDVFTRDEHDNAMQRTGRLVVFQFGVTFALGAICLVLSQNFSVSFSTNMLVAILYTALLAGVLATSIQTYFQRETSPVKAALIFALEPVFASILGVIFLSEPSGLREFSGGGLVIFGVLAAELGGLFENKTDNK